MQADRLAAGAATVKTGRGRHGQGRPEPEWAARPKSPPQILDRTPPLLYPPAFPTYAFFRKEAGAWQE